MASGILLGRNPPLKPPFQPSVSTGINRVPEKAPLDPEKLLSLGLDLTNTARDKVSEACDLFARLDWLARLNRDNLEDEHIATVLADLREDAEVLLERGLYSLDVAQEVRTRLRNHNPEHGEMITRESSRRWRHCFYALSGVWARTYIKVYGMILGAPTCGDLSHIPPNFHFYQPSREARRRYNNRLSVAVGANFPLVVDYWRCRLVKGIEAGELPGSVTLREEVRKWPRGKVTRVERYDGDEYSELVGDNTYIGEGLAALAGPDCTSFVDITQRLPSSEPSSPKSPSLPSEPSGLDTPVVPAPGPPPTTPRGTTRLETITEDSIDELMGTPFGTSTPKNFPVPKNKGEGSLQGPLAKSAQASTARVSRRLQEKREAKDAAPKEPEPPAPPRAPKAPPKRKRETKSQEPTKEPAKKKRATKKSVPSKASVKKSAPSKASTKRSRGAETAAQNSHDVPRPKRPRVLPPPMKLKLKLTEGHDMRPLTEAEMAQLPWNKGKPAGADVDPSKYVFPVSGYLPVERGDLADIRAWADNTLPKAYDDFEDTEDEVAANLSDPADSEVKVEGPEPTGAEGDNTGHAVEDPPSQGGIAPSSGAEAVLHTPSRPPLGPGSVDSPEVDTPEQFEDPRLTRMPLPPVPTATPKPELPPHLRTRTAGVYKQFGPNSGIYFPNLNTSQFSKSSPLAKGATPKGPGASPFTPRQFTAEGVSFAEKSALEIGITTASFLEGWDQYQEEAASRAGGTKPKPAADFTSSPSQRPYGEKPVTPAAAEPSAAPCSSPRLPTPGEKPGTPDAIEPLGEEDALWGSSDLEAQGLLKGPVSEATEGQNASNRGPSSGASKKLTPPKAKHPPRSGRPSSTSKGFSPSTNQSLFGTPPSAGSQKFPRTPPKVKSPSSEPTTGASRTPSPSVADGSTYIDPASRLHFPQGTPAIPSIHERPKTPPNGKSHSREPTAGASQSSCLSVGEGVGEGSTYIDPASRLHFPEPTPASAGSQGCPRTPPDKKLSSSEPTTGASQTPCPSSPPSGSSGKSKASVSSADRAAINAALQEDIEEQETEERRATMKDVEQTMKDVEQTMLDKSLLKAAGISPDGLSPTELRDTVKAIEASVQEEPGRNSNRRRDTDTETTSEPMRAQKQESRKGSEQRKDDATWRAESDHQPEKDEGCDDPFGKEVWDI